MATIPLNDDWRIQSDAHCWMVQRRRTVKRKGEYAEEGEAKTYHPTLDAATGSYVRCTAMESDVVGLAALTATVARLEAEVRSALPSLGGGIKGAD